MPPETEPVVENVNPEAPPSPIAADAAERAALIKAAESATGPEAGTPAPEPAAGVKAAGKASAIEESAAPAESRIATVLRAREQAQRTRDEASSAASQHLETAKEDAAKILADARVEAKRLADAELMEFRKKWRENPLRAIESAGIDRKVLVDDVTREGSPEWQAQRRVERDLEQARAELAELKAWREESKTAAAKQETASQVANQRQAEKRYLDALPKESSLRALYTDAQIVAMTYDVAAQFREAQPGQVASDEDLRVYLEEQATKKLATLRGTSTAAVGATKKLASPRTPNASSASERRSSPKPASEWGPDEEREAQKKAAEDAMSVYAKG